jgi:uncharacterized heparinase superfamily protein
MKQLSLYLRTLAYLRPIQVAYLLQRRFLPHVQSATKTDCFKLRPGISILPGISASSSIGDDSLFCFLGQTKRFQSENADWVCKDMPKLWRYNLHYFDYLHDPQRSLESKSILITDWIRSNPIGTEDAWEPYTVSLRIVNWIKFFLLNPAYLEDGNKRLSRCDRIGSLYRQALWLERNVEYHILANHYLKNGVALFLAGVYFEGVDAERWLRKGLEILKSELQEQFLADGGHFERSPMYHCICLVDYLDVLNLVRNSPVVIARDIADEFTDKVMTALDFLGGICLPDGTIPLFNDSAFGIAPTPQQIFEYAERVIEYKPPRRTADLIVKAFPGSGYYVCRQADDMMIIDCGPIGPDYQPGHAHCDTLSYELVIDGRRVVVDSGVFDYEPSSERAYARSTRAHNTVMVDDEEQSEMWGVFRVARRARPLRAEIVKTANESLLFEGAHDGYMRLKGKPIHKRHISYDGHGNWVITDVLEGKGTHQMESFVHLHPDCSITQSVAMSYRIEWNGEPVATIEALNPCQMRIESGCYFPEFGLSRKNPVIAFSCSGEVPLQLSYRIQKARDRQTEAAQACEFSSCHITSLPK